MPGNEQMRDVERGNQSGVFPRSVSSRHRRQPPGDVSRPVEAEGPGRGVSGAAMAGQCRRLFAGPAARAVGRNDAKVEDEQDAGSERRGPGTCARGHIRRADFGQSGPPLFDGEFGESSGVGEGSGFCGPVGQVRDLESGAA